MKTEKYILFTAGRGPVECTLAVQGIQNRFKKYLDANNITYQIVNQKKGTIPNSMETIVFRVNTSDHQIVKSWLGSLLWICPSPVRKFHKRKNWFIKCEEVFLNAELQFDPKDVTVQTFRASGPGGQHRNKVETAVRLIHKSSGIIVTSTDSKSQHQNKKKAWQKLTEKLKHWNEQSLEDFNADQWVSQLSIERGSPVKTFVGRKFVE